MGSGLGRGVGGGGAGCEPGVSRSIEARTGEAKRGGGFGA